nr:hypothetical protein [Tanacetum cinerariifolium]
MSNDEYKFGMEVPDALIGDAIKKKAGYTYYMAKKVESDKAKIVGEQEKQHISPIKSERGKGEGSSVAHNKHYADSDTDSDATLYSLSLDEPEESANETDDTDESDMDLSNDNLQGYDDATSASEVPLGTHVDVLATKTLQQEMFQDKNAHNTPSLPAEKIPYHTTHPQPSSLQAKAKKLMQKAKKNMRKINFKEAVA